MWVVLVVAGKPPVHNFMGYIQSSIIGESDSVGSKKPLGYQNDHGHFKWSLRVFQVSAYSTSIPDDDDHVMAPFS